jgi:hypothetical protein
VGARAWLSFVLVIFTLSACAVADAPRMNSVIQASDTDPTCSPLGTTHSHNHVLWPYAFDRDGRRDRMAGILENVTPRFPDGLTVLEVDEQYRQSDGTIVCERSRVLVIFPNQKPATREALETLVVRYKKTFAQESVL